MTEELEVLRDLVTRLETARLDYLLTGSVALNYYAQPRLTRDIDVVILMAVGDAACIPVVLGDNYYVSPEAALDALHYRGAINTIHQELLIKVDF